MEVDSSVRMTNKSMANKSGMLDRSGYLNKSGMTDISAMRVLHKNNMENKKKKKALKPMKVSEKSKVITKGTSYSDKYEMRRKMRMSTGSKRTNSNAAMNRLGQKHTSLNYKKVQGIALTKAQKKKNLKKKLREEAREKKQKEENGEMDGDWVSASDESDEDIEATPAATTPQEEKIVNDQ